MHTSPKHLSAHQFAHKHIPRHIPITYEYIRQRTTKLQSKVFQRPAQAGAQHLNLLRQLIFYTKRMFCDYTLFYKKLRSGLSIQNFLAFVISSTQSFLTVS